MTYSPTLLEIGTKKLKEHNGEMTKVSRKGGKYKIEGPLNHQIIKGGDFFIIEAEDDSCFLQTLDEVEIGEQKYWANL